MSNDTPGSIPCICSRLGLNYLLVAIALIMATALSATVFAADGSYIAGYDYNVSVGDQDGPVFVVNNTKTYDIRAFVFAPSNTPKDIYVVAMRPDGRVFSWAAANRNQPTEGMLPLVAAATVDYSTTLDLPIPLQYAFSDRDVVGLYHVYLLVVAPAGADPFDPGNWLVATSKPLLFEGVPK